MVKSSLFVCFYYFSTECYLKTLESETLMCVELYVSEFKCNLKLQQMEIKNLVWHKIKDWKLPCYSHYLM